METKKEHEEKVSEIINREAEAIVKELRRGSSISKDAIVNAAKKRQGEIISRLREAGLQDNEIRERVSGFGKIILTRLRKEVGEEVIMGMAVDELYKKTRSETEKDAGSECKEVADAERKNMALLAPELKFREQMVQKVEEAIYEMTGKRYKVTTEMKQYMTIERPYSFTATYRGDNYDVILKEIIPKNFCDPTVLKVAKYMGTRRYKIKPFEIKDSSDAVRYYAVIEKIHGKNITALKVNHSPIRGLEYKYLKELGKIMALTYVCAIPDRNSNNIIWDRIKDELKLTTFDFAMSFNYEKYHPMRVALVALELNASFLKDTRKENKEGLREGFIEAFNSAKENESKFLIYIKPLRNNAFLEIKKILKQNPDGVFNEMMEKSKFMVN